MLGTILLIVLYSCPPRCPAHLGIQWRLGLLSKRRNWTDPPGRRRSAANGSLLTAFQNLNFTLIPHSAHGKQLLLS